jgi:hypothetical protein
MLSSTMAFSLKQLLIPVALVAVAVNLQGCVITGVLTSHFQRKWYPIQHLAEIAGEHAKETAATTDDAKEKKVLEDDIKALKDIMPEGQKAADAKAAACDEADAAKKELEMAVDAAEKEKSKDRRLADEGAADDAQEKSTDPVEAAQKAFDDAQKKCDEASEKAQKVYKSVEDAINTLRKETHVANETAEQADVSQTSEKFEFGSKGSLDAGKDEDADKPSPLGFAMYICGVMSLSVMGLGFVVMVARKLVVSRSRVTSVRLVAPQEEEPALE